MSDLMECPACAEREGNCSVCGNTGLAEREDAGRYLAGNSLSRDRAELEGKRLLLEARLAQHDQASDAAIDEMLLMISKIRDLRVGIRETRRIAEQVEASHA